MYCSYYPRRPLPLLLQNKVPSTALNDRVNAPIYQSSMCMPQFQVRVPTFTSTGNPQQLHYETDTPATSRNPVFLITLFS